MDKTKNRSAVDIAQELGVYYGTVMDHCHQLNLPVRSKSNSSIVEQMINQYINSLGIATVQHDRTVLNGLEIDILAVSHSIGIEVNGLYWHSYHPNMIKVDDNTRHLRKVERAAEANIQLLHITDYEWYNRQTIVKSIIKTKLGLSTRIGARQCTIKPISVADARQFFDTHHLNGHASAKYYIGLYYNDQIVSAVAIGKLRYRAKDYSHEYELIRFASAHDTVIVGGLSKLLAYARTLGVKSLLSYCSRDMSDGRGYISAGFRLITTTGPGYYWTDGNVTISREKTSHANLAKWLSTYDASCSQDANMYMAGYRKYWNCGNFVFEVYL